MTVHVDTSTCIRREREREKGNLPMAVNHMSLKTTVGSNSLNHFFLIITVPTIISWHPTASDRNFESLHWRLYDCVYTFEFQIKELSDLIHIITGLSEHI